MNAKIVFEDGAVFGGKAFGAVEEKETYGEIVFNTSLSGYQEIITDPSYKGQIVTMTYPLIGNYGVNKEDVESAGPRVEGLIIKDLCRIPSNYRAECSLDEYFKKHGIIGITDVDTRAVTRHVRSCGAMKGIIAAGDTDDVSLVRKVKASPGLNGRDMVKEVSCRETSPWSEEGHLKVAVLDCGVKFSILRHLSARGCRVTTFPASTPAEDILDWNPDGVLFSNGPGDPEGAPYVFRTAKNILGKVPVFGICLGHQMLALAMGGKTYKLKFGHHGGNHPVKDVRSGKVNITAQNHNFCVETGSIKTKDVEVTHVNLNDGTVEGMESRELRFFSVQFHPEAGPGPNDATYLFDRFVGNMKQK